MHAMQAIVFDALKTSMSSSPTAAANILRTGNRRRICSSAHIRDEKKSFDWVDPYADLLLIHRCFCRITFSPRLRRVVIVVGPWKKNIFMNPHNRRSRRSKR
jgi:hypothetical protein